MQRRILCLIAAVLCLTASREAFAQDPDGPAVDKAQATAKASIIQPIGLESEKDLNFGVLIQGNGTCVISPDDDYSEAAIGGVQEFGLTRVGTPAQQHIPGVVGFGQARFLVTGEPGYHFGIYLPVTPQEIKTLIPVHKLTVKDFTTNRPQGGDIDETGAAYFNVGATLVVTSDKRAGIYKHLDFPVRVQYE